MGELATTLRKAIQESGLGYNELGRRAGVDPAVIMRFVNGERDIRLATGEKLAAVLGLQLREHKPPK